jgi:hypothetical protein
MLPRLAAAFSKSTIIKRRVAQPRSSKTCHTRALRFLCIAPTTSHDDKGDVVDFPPGLVSTPPDIAAAAKLYASIIASSKD